MESYHCFFIFEEDRFYLTEEGHRKPDRVLQLQINFYKKADFLKSSKQLELSDIPDDFSKKPRNNQKDCSSFLFEVKPLIN